MAITDEQAEQVKAQLRERIKDYPPQQKQAAEMEVNNMSNDDVEKLLVEQQGIQQGGKSQKGIFRQIVDGDVPSRKVDENKEVVAVVSVRPVSKGHVLIIPKKAVSDGKEMPSSAFVLAKKIGKKMGSRLEANTVEIQTAGAFGEVLINVIPIYDKPVNVNSPPYEASEEEMEEVYQKLRVVAKPKIKRIKQTVKKQGQVIKLSRRIP
jgi:diadenosine tetraphosphate (Ap4A) HIT family hydrolase